MAKYLISFPSAAMVIAEADFAAVAEAAHEVVREAKAAGVYVFGGGIDEDIAPVLVHADGSVTPATSHLDGGFCVLEHRRAPRPRNGLPASRQRAARRRNCGSSDTTPSRDGETADVIYSRQRP